MWQICLFFVGKFCNFFGKIWQSLGFQMAIFREASFVSKPVDPVNIKSGKQFKRKEIKFIGSEIRTLLEQNCISNCTAKPKFISPLNVTPKADKSYRLILDLRELNKHCQPKSFIHEDINTVINLIKPDDYLVAVDLKSAFYHIPVLEEHSTYNLGFE